MNISKLARTAAQQFVYMCTVKRRGQREQRCGLPGGIYSSGTRSVAEEEEEEGKLDWRRKGED